MEKDCGNRLFIEKRNKVYLVSSSGVFRAGVGMIFGGFQPVLKYIIHEAPRHCLLVDPILLLPEDQKIHIEKLLSELREKILERSRVMGKVLSEM